MPAGVWLDVEGCDIRRALAESVAVAEGDLRDIRDAESAAQHRGRRELKSRAQARLDVVPVGIERASAESAHAGEADAAVDLVVRETASDRSATEIGFTWSGKKP